MPNLLAQSNGSGVVLSGDGVFRKVPAFLGQCFLSENLKKEAVSGYFLETFWTKHVMLLSTNSPTLRLP